MPSRKQRLCPKCGLTRKALKSHIDSRICRAEQIKVNMQGYGLYPLPNLTYIKILRWADLPCERIPARADLSGYQKEQGHRDWEGKSLICPAPSYSGEIYEGLGDALFVEEWVAMLLRSPQMPTPSLYKKYHFASIIWLLRAIHGRDDEYKLALMTAHTLGGMRAVHDMLDTELL